jgi:hypothetical protein
MNDNDTKCGWCNDTRIMEEVVCGLCQEDIPHSNCDDTWHREILCYCVTDNFED